VRVESSFVKWEKDNCTEEAEKENIHRASRTVLGRSTYATKDSYVNFINTILLPMHPFRCCLVYPGCLTS
jgi:hypothetical protein